MSLSYSGQQRDGTAITGVTEREGAAELVSRLYAAGAVALTVTNEDGDEVGAIRWEGPRRLWWGEE